MEVRVTGVVIEDGRLLVLNQDTDTGRSFSLPGGKVEPGETLQAALVREMREETGLDVEVGRLLYVCDHPAADVTHMTFQTSVRGGELGWIAGTDTNPIRGVEYVPIDQLPEYGFTSRFRDLVAQGFPGAGHYMGLKANIGL
jgi:ADP-ribose pyrophosphatase YjhB (NUDIX family)